jgi:hypothetical protein
MIPAMHITAWSKFAPWGEQRQIEQDLIISRAIIDIFFEPHAHKRASLSGRHSSQ